MTELWVMRVVKTARQPLAPGDVAAIAEGRYHVVNGDVVEPVECTEVAGGGDLERAQRVSQERAMTLAARTGCVHKVVLSADL